MFEEELCNISRDEVLTEGSHILGRPIAQKFLQHFIPLFEQLRTHFEEKYAGQYPQTTRELLFGDIRSHIFTERSACLRFIVSP